MMMRAVTVIVLAIIVPASVAAADFKLQSSDVVMFFGDGVTQLRGAANRYPVFIESYVCAKYPALQTRFLVNARQNETPAELMDRLTRDVFQYKPKPTVAVVCFGTDTTRMQALQPGQADEFGESLQKLTERLAKEGCTVVLMTPPSADESRNRQLQNVKFNDEVLAPLCEQIKKVAATGQFGLVDWFGKSKEVREERQAKVPGYTLSIDGVNPTPEGHAMAATLLLEYWGADPINETIRFDWDTGEASSSAGKVAARKNDDGSLTLSIEDFPMPWPGFSGRGALMSQDWYAEKMNRVMLTATSVPEAGIMLSSDRREFPVMPVMLEKGMNLATTDVMTGAKEVADVSRYIRTKNTLWDKLITERPKIPEYPELLKAHAMLMDTYMAYYEGYSAILAKTPRRLSLELTFKTISPPSPQTPQSEDPRLKPPDPDDPASYPIPDEKRKIKTLDR